MRTLAFGPSFRHVFRRVAWNLGIPLGGLWGIVALGSLSALDAGSAVELAIVAALFAASVVVGSLVVFALMRCWRFCVDANGITGRNAFGQARTLRWDQIGDIERTRWVTLWGLAVAHKQRPGRHLLLATAGIDRLRLHAHLATFAGPDHPLTLAVADAP